METRESRGFHEPHLEQAPFQGDFCCQARKALCGEPAAERAAPRRSATAVPPFNAASSNPPEEGSCSTPRRDWKSFWEGKRQMRTASQQPCWVGPCCPLGLFSPVITPMSLRGVSAHGWEAQEPCLPFLPEHSQPLVVSCQSWGKPFLYGAVAQHDVFVVSSGAAWAVFGIG